MRHKTLYLLIALLLSLSPLLFLLTPTAQADPSIIQATTTPATGGDSATHLARGIEALTVTFDTATAYAELNAALSTPSPIVWEAYRWRAQLYYEVGALDLALADLNTLLENEPDNVEALIWRARVYAGPFPLGIPLHYFYVSTFGLVGYGRQPELALADIERALALDGENPAVWVAYGDVLAADAYAQLITPYTEFLTLPAEEVEGLLGGVREKYQQALELAAADNFQTGMVLYHSIFFETLLNSIPEIPDNFEPETASAQFEQISTLLAGHPAGAFAEIIGQLVTMVGGDIEIGERMAAILTQFPNHAPLHYWLGLFALNVNRLNDSDLRDFVVPNFQRALELAPYSPIYQFAQTQYMTRAQAIPMLETMLVERPGYPPALFFLTMMYAQEGTLESCDMAALMVSDVQAAPADDYAMAAWLGQIDAWYQQACVIVPTPIPVEVVLLPATSTRFEIGDSVTVPGPVFFKLKESPADVLDEIICSGGSSATVLQIAHVEGDPTTIYLQLECDGGIGWTDETLLPD